MNPPKRLWRLPTGGQRQRPGNARSVAFAGPGPAWPPPWVARGSAKQLEAKTAARSQAGFTLVEVLVALTLMAVLAGLAWQGLAGIAGARTDADRHVEQTLRLNTVLAQWDQDLQAVYNTAVVPALAFDGATLRLVRRHPEGLQIVAWSLREQRWMRWAGPVVTRGSALQESWLASQQLLGNETAQLRMQEGLAGWQMYFYRGNAWSNAQSSGDQAPSVGGGTPVKLPTGVRIVLSLEGAGLSGTLTRDVLMAPQP